MRLCQAARGFRDPPAQLVAYGRSALIDKPFIQSEAAKGHAANLVRREAGPGGGGRAGGIMEDQ